MHLWIVLNTQRSACKICCYDNYPPWVVCVFRCSGGVLFFSFCVFDYLHMLLHRSMFTLGCICVHMEVYLLRKNLLIPEIAIAWSIHSYANLSLPLKSRAAWANTTAKMWRHLYSSPFFFTVDYHLSFFIPFGILICNFHLFISDEVDKFFTVMCF